jgi:predicted unusual protein kinase regulating ubiquinone biosynthesis (AarF/ABC1/UbiB family)
VAAKNITTGRYRRLAQLGGAVTGGAVKRAGTHAVNVVRSEERASVALERHHIQTADQIVAVLGTMKGAAMKLGQMLSVLDVGLVGEEYREEFQRKLAALRSTAPAVPFKGMRKVIEDELGGRLGGTFADFDQEPIAAASIGQVYRATLRDGRDVAVKVQYPGVAGAVRADMQNLGLILRLLGRLAPQLDTKALARAVREEIFEELDYELEAGNQRALRRIYDGHPFIFIPAVVDEHSGERVIVTEFIEGDGFAVLEEETVQERDRVGEIVFRFFLGSMYRHRKFSGDPHPGNLLRRPDGRIAFLDFGLFKQIERAPVEFLLSTLRAMVEENEVELHRLLAGDGFLPDPSSFDPAELMSYMLDAYWWCTKADRDVTITPELTTKVLSEHLGPRSSHFGTTRRLDINTEHLLGRRLELLVLAVLGQLKATANWHRIAREWIYDDPPVTELGRQETEFLSAGA